MPLTVTSAPWAGTESAVTSTRMVACGCCPNATAAVTTASSHAAPRRCARPLSTRFLVRRSSEDFMTRIGYLPIAIVGGIEGDQASDLVAQFTDSPDLGLL